MKKNVKLTISAIAIATLSINTFAYASSTTNTTSTNVATSTKTTATTTATTATDTTETVDLSPKATSFTDDMLSDKYTSSSTITLKDNASTSTSKNVSIKNNVITIKSAGTYVISGNLSDGQIIVDTDDKEKVQLVLKDANINSKTNAPIYVQNAKYAMITLADGTTNTLTDTETPYVLTSDEDIDSVIYSKDDLVLNGTGTLNVTAKYNDAIKSNDTLYIVSGNYNVNSKQDAFYGKDAIIIDGGNFDVYTYTGADSVEMVAETFGGGGFPANMTLPDGTTFDPSTMTPPEGFDPSTMTPPTGGGFPPNMTLPDGTTFDPSTMTPPAKPTNNFGSSTIVSKSPTDSVSSATPNTTNKSTTTKTTNATATTKTTTTVDAETTEVTEDTGSHKGFKSKGEIIINDGTFDLDVYDDGINAGTFLEINDGDFTVNSGDDAIKGEYVLTINGGKINITNCYEGLESKVLHLNGGDITVSSFDDGINASDPDATSEAMPIPFGSDVAIDYENDPIIYFDGANVVVNASGDAIDANGAIIINSGNIEVHGVNNGGELAVDADKSTVINGGNLFVLGGFGTASSSSKQNVVTVSLGGTISAGKTVTVSDSTGKTIFETVAKRDTTAVTFSSNLIKTNETYTIKGGDVTKTIKSTATVTKEATNNMGGMGGRGTKPTTGTTTTTPSTTTKTK